MKKILALFLVMVLLISNTAFAALTKAVEAVDEWQAIAANTGILEGATVDLTAHYQSVLTIAVALTTNAGTATNGCEIKVQISSNTTGDEDWIDLTSFQGPTSTALAINTETITNNPLAVGGTSITMASTTGYAIPSATTDNGLRYLKDATIANSEIVYQTAVTTNTNITIIEGVTNQHANTAVLSNVVGVYTIQLPDSANRCRVIYNNTKDAASGSGVDVMSRMSSITGI